MRLFGRARVGGLVIVSEDEKINIGGKGNLMAWEELRKRQDVSITNDTTTAGEESTGVDPRTDDKPTTTPPTSESLPTSIPTEDTPSATPSTVETPPDVAVRSILTQVKMITKENTVIDIRGGTEHYSRSTCRSLHTTC
jgi:hypothetical protein